MVRYAQNCDGKFPLEIACQSERKSDKSAALLPFQKRHFPGGRGGVVIGHGVRRQNASSLVVWPRDELRICVSDN